MVRLVIAWGLNAVALWILDRLLPGFALTGFGAAVVLAAALAVVNALVRPLVLFFTLPLNVVTLGCFTFVVNGLMFLLATHLVAGARVGGLGNAIIAAFLFSLLSGLLRRIWGD